jgi:hypothetical protein
MGAVPPERREGVSVDLEAARALLPGVRLEALEQLHSGERSEVHRVRATWPDRPPTSIVVKRFLDAGEGWVRETAALSVLPRGAASGLIVAGDAPPIVVTEDLGTGHSVADALLGRDSEAAAESVRLWAEAVARLHVTSHQARDEFAHALAERQGDLPVAASRVWVETDDSVRVLDAHCASLGISVPTHALDELRELAHRLGSTDLAALTPADTCPDNNARVDDRVVLIDFEGAQWRHIAWDVAYLFVPWPSCWCSWRLPAAVTRAAFAAYRAVAAEAFPEVAQDSFVRDVEAATVGWALTSTSWFLSQALGSDPPFDPTRPTPTRRAMILHRLGVAAASDELPALAELARRLATELQSRWGDAPLAYANAFATSDPRAQ